MAASTPIYHPVATGTAAETVKYHSDPADVKLWAGWFCPFTQRTWVALEEKGIPYQYHEVNPYLKEDSFLAVSPKGLTPGLQIDGQPLHDSNVINEFLEDRYPSSKASLLPRDPYQRAQARLAIDEINKAVVPAFFRLLQAQPGEPDKQAAARQELANALRVVCKQWRGPFFFGETLSLVDVAIAPWAVRDFIVREYRGFKREDVDGWKEWADNLEKRPSVHDTTSDPERYIEFNGTFLRNESHSLAGKAARSGQAIP